MLSSSSLSSWFPSRCPEVGRSNPVGDATCKGNEIRGAKGGGGMRGKDEREGKGYMWG